MTIEERLLNLSTAPSDESEYQRWLLPDNAVEFLRENVTEDEVVVFASLPHVFIHAVLIPTSRIATADPKHLVEWDCDPYSAGWGICCGFDGPSSIRISGPLEDMRNKILEQGEQLVFMRNFAGRLGEPSYCEVLQKFVHSFSLHYIEEHRAYCRFDSNGDLDKVIRVQSIPSSGKNSLGTAVIFRRELLDEYMALTDSAMMRMFDFTRFRSPFGGWRKEVPEKYETEDMIRYRCMLSPGYASYMRGSQIVLTSLNKEEIYARQFGLGNEEREYASFVAIDWKNDVIRDISTEPGATANYFTDSELPYEMSPAFFRPDVLQRYKVDSDKYTLSDRSITCRGAWHLETYDINKEGQVHSYIVYLRRLPYSEQLHWKAHNEPPRATISERAHKTDFEGSWDLSYDPLISLRERLHVWDSERVPWWTLRNEKLPEQVHYPVTSSADEWANELHALDKFIVEGFEEAYLRKDAQTRGRKPPNQYRSLKLIEECLVARGFEEAHAKEIIDPLQTLHHLRSVLVGHASGSDATEIRRTAIKEQGSYAKHFRVVCAQCDDSLRIIQEAISPSSSQEPG